ncbi:MAG: hypothetical protein QM765_36545 [Myxococcales bacterium]
MTLRTLGPAFLLLLLAACGSGPGLVADAAVGAGPDASLPDASQPDATISGRDASAPVAFDASLAGTALEHVVVECPEPLDLCTRWSEGNSAAGEQARHVHLALPKLERSGLEPAQLAQAQVDGALAESGNLAAQRWRLAPGTVGHTLRKYALSRPNGATQLAAEIAHDLGAAGTLVESYSLYRSAQTTGPVVLDGVGMEASFSLERPGLAEPISLVRCDGGAGMEAGVEVLRATRAGRTLVLTRFLNTRPADAGSYPVHVTGLRLAFTDGSLPTLDADDFFAHTYVAQHHNWAEASIVDFSQDPRLYHTLFRPLAEGDTSVPSEVPERLALHDVNTLGTQGWLELTTRKAGGAQLTERWDVQGGLARVDAADLLRNAAAACTGARVFMVGYFEVTGLADSFQLVTCPQAAAPGYALKAVVPVWYPRDPTVIGTRIEGSAISPVTTAQGTGHAVKLGGVTISFVTSDGQVFLYEVRDAQGTLLSSYSSGATELGPYEPPRIETLVATDGQGTSMELVRQWAGVGVGKSSLYAPLSFRLTFAGRTVLVDAMDALRYTNTHHNWEDELEARGEGLVLRWRTSFTSATPNEVQVAKDSGEVVLPWTALRK